VTINRLRTSNRCAMIQNKLARDRYLRSRASCPLVTSVIGLPMASPGPSTVRALFIGAAVLQRLCQHRNGARIGRPRPISD